MENVKEMILNIINQLEQVTDDLYKQEIKKAYLKFNNMLTDLANTIDMMYMISKQMENPTFNCQTLTLKLSDALQAIEAGDAVLLADILQYDLKEQLMECHNSL